MEAACLIALNQKRVISNWEERYSKYSLKTNVFESFVSSIMKEAYVSYGLFTRG